MSFFRAAKPLAKESSHLFINGNKFIQ